MSEILKLAFLIIAGGFLFGIMFYVFYLGLKPNKEVPETGQKKLKH